MNDNDLLTGDVKRLLNSFRNMEMRINKVEADHKQLNFCINRNADSFVERIIECVRSYPEPDLLNLSSGE